MSAIIQTPTRLPMIERLRLLAMFEIVAFHTGMAQRLEWLGGFGLPAFLLLGAAFSVLAAERRGAANVFSNKLRTVGAAWVFWSIVYAIIAAVVLSRRGESIEPLLDPLLWLSGVRMHLWFAPFAVLAGGTAAAVHVATRNASRTLRFALSLAVGTGWIVLVQHLHVTSALTLQWLFALPSIPLGMAIAELIRARGRARRSVAAWLFVWCALVALGSFTLPSITPIDVVNAAETLRRYALSTALIVAAVLVPGSLDAFTRRFAPYMLGVYFVHIVLRDLLLPFVGENQFIASLAVFAASIATVELLHRSPLRRYVVMTPQRASHVVLTSPAETGARAD